MNKAARKIIPLILALCFILSACAGSTLSYSGSQDAAASAAQSAAASSDSPAAESSAASCSLDEIPAFDQSPYVVINGNEPYFSDSDYTQTAFENYSDLDNLGRCGAAYANVCTETMPTEERGEIGQVKPTGWHLVKYDSVDGKYLYNRCHLIGFQLTGENANEKNLITGTRYLNVDGMLPFENMVADYVKETGNHVLYRVTPVFSGSNLVASGVLMEAKSVEDKGGGICFCVYCYNNQPGITIDYSTGDSWLAGETPAETASPSSGEAVEQTYIINTSTGKFHYPDCSSVDDISDSNKQVFTGSRDELIADGYSPCGRCKP